jgi:uncharacterized protein (UPF0333 family)
MINKKADIEIDMLIKILLIIIFLGVMLFVAIKMSGSGTGMIAHIKNLFNFGSSSLG